MLCRFRPGHRLAELVRLSGRSSKRVEAVVTPQLLRDLDLGRVKPAELLDRLRVGLDWDCDYATLMRAWSAAFEPDHGVIAIARRVRGKNGLLTDNGPPLADNFERCLPEVAAIITTPVFSSDVAVTKPDQEAFWAACRRLEAEPTRTLFIDDNRRNVVGARAAGLVAVRYTTPEQLLAELDGRDVLHSP